MPWHVATIYEDWAQYIVPLRFKSFIRACFSSPYPNPRHCEERSDVAISFSQSFFAPSPPQFFFNGRRWRWGWKPGM